MRVIVNIDNEKQEATAEATRDVDIGAHSLSISSA